MIGRQRRGGGGVRTRLLVSCQCVRGGEVGGEGGRGNKEDDDDKDEVNGDEVNGKFLQWGMATRNGAVLTSEGYYWEVGRGEMLWRWDVWVAECADGRCEVCLFCCHACEKWKFGGLRGDAWLAPPYLLNKLGYLHYYWL